MDKIDYLILSELGKNARKPFRQIAKKIGASTQTVIKKFNSMVEKGTIQNCTISIDLRKIGYKGMAYLLITAAFGCSLTETMEQLKKTTNIVIATKSIGDFEGYAVLVFRDLLDLHEQVLKIKSLPNIEKVEISCSTKDFMNIFPPNRPPKNINKK